VTVACKYDGFKWADLHTQSYSSQCNVYLHIETQTFLFNISVSNPKINPKYCLQQPKNVLSIIRLERLTAYNTNTVG
jgi:hypothetical protein